MDARHNKPDRNSFACLTNSSFSGSTIFSLLIDSHPEIVALGDGLNPEILRRRHENFVCSCGAKIGECAFWQSIMEEVRHSGLSFSFDDCNMRYSFLRPSLDRLLGRYYRDPLRASLRWTFERIVPTYKRHVDLHTARNRAFINAVLDVSKKSVFIHNTKPLMMLHFLSRDYAFNVRVINMVRDPRGFVHSAAKRGMSIAAAALRWNRHHRSVQVLLESIEARRIFNLRYEDVCEDVNVSLGPLCRFLGVDPKPISKTITPKAHHVLGNDLRLRDSLTIRLDESWKTSLSSSDVRLIGKTCGPLADEFGYSL